MKLYRGFETQDQLDREYNPSLTSPNAAATFVAWQERSARACRDRPCHLDLRYGPTLAEHVDLFPAGPGAPVHIFVHGGYWRRFSARDHAFVGAALAQQGLTTVVVNYELCPRVTIDEIVREVRAATVWTFKEIARFDGDPARLTVSGHSAGGHLVAMLLATDWEGEYGLPADLIKGALPISGLFDLAPFPYTYLQPALQLDWGQVSRNSPIGLEPRVRCPVVVAVGTAESAEFRRQSRDYAQHLSAQGFAARPVEVAGADHFTVLEALVEPTAPLARALHELAGRP